MKRFWLFSIFLMVMPIALSVDDDSFITIVHDHAELFPSPDEGARGTIRGDLFGKSFKVEGRQDVFLQIKVDGRSLYVHERADSFKKNNPNTNYACHSALISLIISTPSLRIFILSRLRPRPSSIARLS